MFILSREGGLLGHLVADRLQRMGHPVAVLGGQESGLESIPIGDARAVQRALGYAKGLLVLPPGPQEKRLDEGILRDMALEARISRFIRISVQGADPASPHRFLARQGTQDDAWLDSGLSGSVLRPHAYMQDLLLYAEHIKETRRLPGPDGEPRIGFVDVRDVADAAVALLQRPFHMGESYEITGPRAWSMAEVTGAISDAIGTQIGYDVIPAASYADHLVEIGLEPERAQHVAASLSAYGPDTQRTRSMARITGLPPRALEMFLLDHRGHFARKPSAVGPILSDLEVVNLDHPLTW